MIRRALIASCAAVVAVALVAGPVGAGEDLLTADVAPTSAAAGETFVVTGDGCSYPLAGAVLLRDGTGLGVADVVEPELGAFVLELTVPAGTPAGPAVIQVDCGFDGETVLSLDLDVAITAAEPTTTISTTTTATAAPAPAPAAVAAAPRFTG